MAEHRVASSDGDRSRGGRRQRGLLTTWTQIRASFLLRRRLLYALTLRNVSMHFDLARWIRAMPGTVLLTMLLSLAGALIFSMIFPAGTVGENKIVMNRQSGERFISINGEMSPVYNLSSARLILGTYGNPVPVTPASIDRASKGSRVGISGAPDDMPVTNGAGTSAAACQRVPVNSITEKVKVAAIDGVLLAGRATELAADRVALARMNGQTYIIWNGAKSLVDPGDRIVLSALGIDSAAVARAMPLNPNVGNAIPSSLPMVDPVVPESGAASPWNLGVEAPIGAVVQSDLPGRGNRFYLVLRDGLQEVSPTVAAMLRSENAFGTARPPAVSPDVVTPIPLVTLVQTSQYPPNPVQVINPREQPVLCWVWEKGRTAAAASAKVVTGTDFPVASLAGSSLVESVTAKVNKDVADLTYVAPSAANFVATTGNSINSPTKESFWWISPSGTRFGVPNDTQDRSALGLTAEPLSMPWVILRLFPRGLPRNVALTHDDAKMKHDNEPVDPAPAPLVKP
ncbi:type VII secretion protein EccB [Mycobacteroides abscessus]|uniref:type VII secretion protein EccB n=1 Tax=Mycobacteroides abscessus TaxID=36809 RepID=UPI0013F69D8C|nr:type VII secretion protein EccB [Mycobacteroides abscessus]